MPEPENKKSPAADPPGIVDSADQSVQPAPYDYLKLFRNAVIFVILLVIGIATAKPAYLKYRIWRAGHLTIKAQQKINEGDFQAASLLAQQSQRLLPLDPESNRILGIIGTRVGDINAMYFWHNAVLMAPENSEYKLQCAQAAVRFGQFQLAGNLLDKIEASHGKKETWLSLSASCAMSRGDYDQALAIFEKLIRTDPTDKRHLVNLDCLNLMSANKAIREQARQRLESLRRERGLSKPILRNLARYYRHFNQPGEALLTMEELKQEHGLSWPERVVYADLKRSVSESLTQEEISKWEEEAVDDANGIYFMSNWYLKSGRPAEALDTLNSGGQHLPIPSLYFLKAEALMQLQDWKQLEKHLETPTAGGMDFLRTALLARVDREFNRPTSGQKWDLAVELSNGLPMQLNTLSSIAYRWEWEDEAVEIYWDLARQSQLPELGLIRLIGALRDKHDKRPLKQALEMLYNLHPVERRGANDLAMLDLIFNDNLERAHRIARENYYEKPENVSFAATFAMSLYRQNKALQGLKVFLLLDKELVSNFESLRLIHGLLLFRNRQISESARILNGIDENNLDLGEIELLKTAKAEVFQSMN